MPLPRPSLGLLRTATKGEQAVQRRAPSEAFHQDAVPCSSDDKRCCGGRGGRDVAEGLVRNGRVRSVALRSRGLMS